MYARTHGRTHTQTQTHTHTHARARARARARSFSLSVLYLEGIKYGDTQMTLTGLLMTGAFFALSAPAPIDRLAPIRPLARAWRPRAWRPRTCTPRGARRAAF